MEVLAPALSSSGALRCGYFGLEELTALAYASGDVRNYLKNDLTDADFSGRQLLDDAEADKDTHGRSSQRSKPTPSLVALMPKLQILVVAQCGLSRLDLERISGGPRAGAIAPFRQLRHLIASDNRIASLPEDLPDRFPALEFLDLAGNQVSSFVETGKLATLALLKSLDLSRNPIITCTTPTTSKKSAFLKILYLVPQLETLNRRAVDAVTRGQVLAGILPTELSLAEPDDGAEEEKGCLPGSGDDMQRADLRDDIMGPDQEQEDEMERHIRTLEQSILSSASAPAARGQKQTLGLLQQEQAGGASASTSSYWPKKQGTADSSAVSGMYELNNSGVSVSAFEEHMASRSRGGTTAANPNGMHPAPAGLNQKQNPPMLFMSDQPPPGAGVSQGAHSRISDLSPIAQRPYDESLIHSLAGDGASPTTVNSRSLRKAQIELLHRMSPGGMQRREHKVHTPHGFGFRPGPREKETGASAAGNLRASDPYLDKSGRTGGGRAAEPSRNANTDRAAAVPTITRAGSVSPQMLPREYLPNARHPRYGSAEPRTITPSDTQHKSELETQLEFLLKRNEDVVNLALMKAGYNFKQMHDHAGGGESSDKAKLDDLRRILLRSPTHFVDVFLQLCLHIIRDKEKRHHTEHGRHVPFRYSGVGEPHKEVSPRRRDDNALHIDFRGRSPATTEGAVPRREQYLQEEDGGSASSSAGGKWSGGKSGRKMDDSVRGLASEDPDASELMRRRQKTVDKWLQMQKEKSPSNNNKASPVEIFQTAYGADVVAEEDEEDQSSSNSEAAAQLYNQQPLFPVLSFRPENENLKRICLPARLRASGPDRTQPLHSRWKPGQLAGTSTHAAHHLPGGRSPEERAFEHQMQYYHWNATKAKRQSPLTRAQPALGSTVRAHAQGGQFGGGGAPFLQQGFHAAAASGAQTQASYSSSYHRGGGLGHHLHHAQHSLSYSQAPALKAPDRFDDSSIYSRDFFDVVGGARRSRGPAIRVRGNQQRSLFAKVPRGIKSSGTSGGARGGAVAGSTGGNSGASPGVIAGAAGIW
eukprot:CAMPEP_0179009448 /NCGR_PEP_ID=MMETSP0795-20121207/16279_1 /TAXON_ID=88552 /ORGANISM="Amoebophrya sp., Strain Ameob2" /LENGTH=1042 /DNA_ID=CAMNT_0020704649 /DNA_START=194 /DNA_END=3319 /DNA_ORIENTATION=-